MPLWGGRQFQSTGNTRPVYSYAPYYAVPQGGTLVPGAANNSYNVANVVGVTANGMANTLGAFAGKGGPAHAGWIAISVGRGFIRDMDRVLSSGNNIANGAYANVNYLTSNGANATIQVTAVTGNGVIGGLVSFAIRNGGDSINTANTQLVNVGFTPNPGLGSNAYGTIFIGGRAGRVMSETLVAMGSLTGSIDQANNWFVNNA